MRENRLLKIICHILLPILIVTLIVSIIYITSKDSIYYNEGKYFQSEDFVRIYMNEIANYAKKLVDDNISIFSLLPAYALSEIKSAFIIGFYIYLPFVVVDLVISSVLLTLGMMMMSPVTISTPIKLILFVAMDGWTMLSKGLILQYFDLSINP